MKRQLIAGFLVIVMVASVFTVLAATTATPVAALTATQTTLIASKTNPVINEPVIFTVKLYAGSTPSPNRSRSGIPSRTARGTTTRE